MKHISGMQVNGMQMHGRTINDNWRLPAQTPKTMSNCMRLKSSDSGMSEKSKNDTDAELSSSFSRMSTGSTVASIKPFVPMIKTRATYGQVFAQPKNLNYYDSQIKHSQKPCQVTEWPQPDAQLQKKIVDLMEFYFSDEYLKDDKYLIRTLRSKTGYMSIKLMCSYKRIKKLRIQDWRTVREALMTSKKLIVSPDGNRVKRADPLPDTLQKQRLLYSVIAVRLTDEYRNVDALTKLFGQFGEVGLVRLIKPGSNIPFDLKNYATQIDDIGKSLCAVIEYDDPESSASAVRELKIKFCESQMRVAFLGPGVKRALTKAPYIPKSILENNKKIQANTITNNVVTTRPAQPCSQVQTNYTSTKTIKMVQSSASIVLSPAKSSIQLTLSR